MKKLGYLATVINSETYQCKNSYSCVQPFLPRELHLLFQTQQLVETIDEIREQMEEGCIEVYVQLVKLLLLRFRRPRKLFQLIIPARLYQTVHPLAHEATHIFFFHTVGIAKLQIALTKPVVERRKLPVEYRKLLIALLQIVTNGYQMLPLAVGIIIQNQYQQRYRPPARRAPYEAGCATA